MGKYLNLKNSEKGQLNALVIPIVLLVVAVLGLGGFGIWAFVERQDYKDNSDAKAAAASSKATQAQKKELDAAFLEKEKEPLKVYKGSAEYGSVEVKYPKTWAAYVDERGGAGEFPLNAFFYPNYVPSRESAAKYTLRVQVTNESYPVEVRKYQGAVQEGRAKSTAYRLPKVEGALGVRIDGDIGEGKQGSLIILPVRDKALRISTESKDFLKDFDTIILPNITFSR
jgi:hypothetical protein